MILRNLNLVEFRNFHRQRVDLLPRLNFFVGDNGQGKTNLIEAVYLLCRGTSFRPVERESLIFHSATQTHIDDSAKAKVSAVFFDRDRQYQTDMLFSLGRKHATINGKRATSTELARTFPCVLFSPESLAAIKDGPEQRRLLVDEVLLIQGSNEARMIDEYSKILRSRNRLLKNMAKGEGDPRENEDTLLSMNKIFLMLGAHLTYARIQALNQIRDDFATAMQVISQDDGDASVDVSVDYLISDASAMNWNESEIFETLQQRLQLLGAREIATGSSLVGPHKHDIKFLFAGNDSRFYCSQGQQRALILAFKIAQIVYHDRVHQTFPVLLLDDVLSELDVKKRVNLMKFVEGISAQVLITATDLTWSDQFADSTSSVFKVKNGQIGPLSSA